MSTVVYNDYYSNIQANNLDIANVFFNVKLVAEMYEPDANHKTADVDKWVINGVGTHRDNAITTKSMQELIDQAKAKMLEGFKLFPYEIGQEIDALFPQEKADKLKQLITMPSDNNYQLWKDLAENGLKYFVVECPELDVLCWCEEITM